MQRILAFAFRNGHNNDTQLIDQFWKCPVGDSAALPKHLTYSEYPEQLLGSSLGVYPVFPCKDIRNPILFQICKILIPYLFCQDFYDMRSVVTRTSPAYNRAVLKKGRPSDQQIPDSKNCLSPPHDLYGLPWSRNVHYLIEFTSRLRLLPAKERPCDLSVYRCQDMEDDIWFLLIFHDLSFSLSLLIPFPETDHAVKPSFSNGSLS